MPKIAITISYDGSAYCGWQTQKGSGARGLPSLQEAFTEAILKILGLNSKDRTKIRLMASGRTDAGVHSLGQTLHLDLREVPLKLSLEKLLIALNGTLRGDMRVTSVRAVKDEFHAQRSAVKKQYSYYFQQGPCSLPHLQKYSLWIRRPLDLKAMQLGLDFLRGEHDFKVFQASGGVTKTTVRTLFETKVERVEIEFPEKVPDEFHLIRIKLVGSGFLKQMVRSIAGTILQIGEGKRAPSDMVAILKSQDRKTLGTTLHPRGLWLERVWYPID
jgi:tRNA pseudouridine38-40 synthase